MKKRFKAPKYQTELFDINSVTVEDNTLYISGDHFDEGVLLGTQYGITAFSFVCNDAEVLADMLNIHMDSLAESIKHLIKGHIDLLYDYCRKHGLECTYTEDEIPKSSVVNQ